jgi:hypothetical protein
MRQHLTLEGLFPATAACGFPVNNWSTAEIRTPIGMTCRTCIRNVTKRGKHRMRPIVRLLRPLYLAYFTRRANEKAPEPEVISTDDLFD